MWRSKKKIKCNWCQSIKSNASALSMCYSNQIKELCPASIIYLTKTYLNINWFVSGRLIHVNAKTITNFPNKCTVETLIYRRFFPNKISLSLCESISHYFPFSINFQFIHGFIEYRKFTQSIFFLNYRTVVIKIKKVYHFWENNELNEFYRTNFVTCIKNRLYCCSRSTPVSNLYNTRSSIFFHFCLCTFQENHHDDHQSI